MMWEERTEVAATGGGKMRKKRRLQYVVVLVVMLIVLLLYHTGRDEKSRLLSQSDLVWNTKEELKLLSGIENRIARAEQGQTEVIPVSTTATGYEDVCPRMKARTEDCDESEAGFNREEKTVFLTFDDGPSRQTAKILDILEQYQIKASFFVVSKDLTESGAEAMQRATVEGHVIGMHSHTHDYKKIYASVETLLKDYNEVYQMIQDTTGITPKFYRFPGGSYNTIGKNCIKEAIPELARRGFVYFDWNVTAEDAVGNPTASSIKKNIFHNLDQIVQPVILMHDGPCNSLTVEVLPEIIEELIKRGYSFDTLDHRKPCVFQW